MPSLVAYILVTAVTSAAVLLLERRAGPIPPRPVPWDLADNARKQVTVLSGLSGFAITNIVLLVTFAANRTAAQAGSFDSLVALLVVAYLTYVSTGLMYATLVQGGEIGDPETQKLQYVIATSQQFRGTFVGWLSLAPLMDAFELDRLAALLDALLLAAALVGWLFQSVPHVRLGYLHARGILFGPALTIGFVTLAAFILRTRVDGAADSDSVLYMAAVAFALAGVSLLLGSLISLGADYPVIRAAIIHRRGRVIVTLLSQATLVLLGFLWLGVVGLI